MFRARLHRSSLVVGVIATILLVLLCVPGRVYKQFPGDSSKREHGWPFVYLRRETEEPTISGITPKDDGEALESLPMLGIPWLSARNWRFWEARDVLETPRQQFNTADLVSDAVLFALLPTSIVILFEYRRRRRASVLSFSLCDVFASLTLVCCALGWFGLAKNSFQHELAGQAVLEAENSPAGFEVMCVAPSWARALIGDRWMPSFMWRAGVVNAPADIAQIPALCNDIQALPYSTKLVVYGAIFGDGHYPYARLKAIRQLDTLQVGTDPRLDDRDVQELSQLSGLKKLILSEGLSTPRLVERLQAALPRCTIVSDDADL